MIDVTWLAGRSFQERNLLKRTLKFLASCAILFLCEDSMLAVAHELVAVYVVPLHALVVVGSNLKALSREIYRHDSTLRLFGTPVLAPLPKSVVS